MEKLNFELINVCSSSISLDRIKKLIEEKANIDAKNSQSQTAFHLACLNPKMDSQIYQFFIENKALISPISIDLVFHSDVKLSLEILEHLLSEYKININLLNKERRNLFHLLCSSNKMKNPQEFIPTLIEKKCDINARGKYSFFFF